MPEYLNLSSEKLVACQRLFQFAGRIASLFDTKRVQSHPSMQASLDDLLGAVYSLIYARRHEYDDRQQPLEPNDFNNVAIRAKDMCSGKVRTEGKWTAGFYFNNALFRISAVYHRALKIIAEKEKTEEKLGTVRGISEKLYRQWRKSNWTSTNLKELHKEVNGLKHSAGGIYIGRTVQFKVAIEALDELLNLVEAWAKSEATLG